MRKLGYPESPAVAIDELVEVFLLLRGGHSVKCVEQKAIEVAMSVCTFSSHSSILSADVVREWTSKPFSSFDMLDAFHPSVRMRDSSPR